MVSISVVRRFVFCNTPWMLQTIDCLLVRISCMHMQIIETKVKKLEQLVRLKDAKIQTLISKTQAAGLA